MTGFLVLKDKIVNFYNEHGALVRPVIKFLVTFVAFTLINSHIGYLEILDNQLMLLVAAIVLSFVPWSLIVVVFSGMVIVISSFIFFCCLTNYISWSCLNFHIYLSYIFAKNSHTYKLYTA